MNSKRAVYIYIYIFIAIFHFYFATMVRNVDGISCIRIHIPHSINMKVSAIVFIHKKQGKNCTLSIFLCSGEARLSQEQVNHLCSLANQLNITMFDPKPIYNTAYYSIIPDLQRLLSVPPSSNFS